MEYIFFVLCAEETWHNNERKHDDYYYDVLLFLNINIYLNEK